MAPGKLAKFYKAHQRTNKLPKPQKIERRNAAPKKAPCGADAVRGYDPFRRQDLLDDQKKVDAELKKKEAEVKANTQIKKQEAVDKVGHKDPNVEAKEKEEKVKIDRKDPNAEPKQAQVGTKIDHKDPAVEAKKKIVEIVIDEKDPNVEVIHCPDFVTHVRVTNLTRAEGGEMARMKKLIANASHYPHITFHGKDDVGRTIIRRRKLEPATLKEMRDAIVERQREPNAHNKTEVDTSGGHELVGDKNSQLDDKKGSRDLEEGRKEGEPASHQVCDIEQKITTTVASSAAVASDKKEDTNLARKKRARKTEEFEVGESTQRPVRPLKRTKVAAASTTENNQDK